MKKFCHVRCSISRKNHYRLNDHHHGGTTIARTTLTEATQAIMFPPNSMIHRGIKTASSSSSSGITLFSPVQLHPKNAMKTFSLETPPIIHGGEWHNRTSQNKVQNKAQTSFFSTSSTTSRGNSSNRGDLNDSTGTATSATNAQQQQIITAKSDRKLKDDETMNRLTILKAVQEQAQHLCVLAHSNTFRQKYTNNENNNFTSTKEGTTSQGKARVGSYGEPTMEDVMKAVEAAQTLLTLTFPPESFANMIYDEHGDKKHSHDNNENPNFHYEKEQAITTLHRAFLAVTSWCLSVTSTDPSILHIVLDLSRRAADLSLPLHAPLYQKFAMEVAQHAHQRRQYSQEQHQLQNVPSACSMILDISKSMHQALDVPVTESFFHQPLLSLVQNGQMEEAVDLIYGMKKRYKINSIGLEPAHDIIDVILERHDSKKLMEADPYTMELVLLLKSAAMSSNTIVEDQEDDSKDDEEDHEEGEFIVQVKNDGASKRSSDVHDSSPTTIPKLPKITIQSSKEVLVDSMLQEMIKSGNFTLKTLLSMFLIGSSHSSLQKKGDENDDKLKDNNESNKDSESITDASILLAKILEHNDNNDGPSESRREHEDIVELAADFLADIVGSNGDLEKLEANHRSIMTKAYDVMVHEKEEYPDLFLSYDSSSSSSSDDDGDDEEEYDYSGDSSDDSDVTLYKSKKMQQHHIEDDPRIVDAVPADNGVLSARLPSSSTTTYSSDQEIKEDLLYVRNSSLWKLPDVTDQIVQLNNGKKIQYEPEYETELINILNGWDDESDDDDDDFGVF